MQSAAEAIWALLTNPTVAYLLLIAGLWAVVFAVTVPGTGIPEAAAVICLALALVGLTQLPTNWAGLGLVGLAFILFIIEFQAAAHGALLISGVIVLFVGSLLLFHPTDTGGATLSWLTVLLVTLGTSGGFGFLIYKGIAALSLPVVHNPDRLIGMEGVARTDIDGEGSVYVGGELWSAGAATKIPAGSRVEVVRRDGLRVEVKLKETGES